MPLLNEVIENNFTYHSPNPSQQLAYMRIKQLAYMRIRDKAKELAYLIEKEVPPSREKSLAMTNLEQSVFWANTGVTRN